MKSGDEACQDSLVGGKELENSCVVPILFFLSRKHEGVDQDGRNLLRACATQKKAEVQKGDKYAQNRAPKGSYPFGEDCDAGVFSCVNDFTLPCALLL